ncbi:MAG: MobH family relaxase [Methylophilus sp.]|uniref:MobH family relaxase n=1 Tax=Methylophilus sp. TaxID=29541 RepID=UPI003FA0CF5A
MFKLINSIMGLLQKSDGVAYHPNSDYSKELDNVPRWPPFDNGLPNLPVETILKTQNELIEQIHRQITNPLVDEAILNFVRYVHLLPATKDENHRGAGGLFRMGLEVAYHSVRQAEGKIFTAAETPDVRQQTEPKWRFAAFLAGLCCETYRVMSGMVITAPDGKKWPALNTPLVDWLEQGGHERYFLSWVQNNSLSSHQAQTMSSYVANQIIPVEATLQISTDYNEIALALMATINGSGMDHPNPLTTIVQDVRGKIIQKDIDGDKSSFGKAIVGTHLDPYIITAMRKLIHNGTWKVNEKGSRVWVDKLGGIYIIWKTAFPELYQNLESQQIKGVPNDMHVIADMMVKGGAFNQDAAKNSNYFMIYPPTSNDSYPAVKIDRLDIIFDLDTQRALKPVPNDLRKPAPAQMTDEQIGRKISKAVTNGQQKNAEIIGNIEAQKPQQNQQDMLDLSVQPNIQPLETNSAQIEVVNYTDPDLSDIPPPDAEYTPDISAHIVFGDQDDESHSPSSAEDEFIDPDMGLLIPVSTSEPQLNANQKIELQKLDPKTAKFIESAILSHQLSKIDPRNKPVGFVHTHKDNSKQSILLYAIPLTHADTLKLDRVLMTTQLHSAKFAWTEAGKTQKVVSLHVPQTNKKEMCIVLKAEISKLLELTT